MLTYWQHTEWQSRANSVTQTGQLRVLAVPQAASPEPQQQEAGWAHMSAFCRRRSYSRIVREELLHLIKRKARLQFPTPQFSKRRERRKRKQKSQRKWKANPCVSRACCPFLKPFSHSTSCEHPAGHLTWVDTACCRQKWHRMAITGLMLERKSWCRTSSWQPCASH